MSTSASEESKLPDHFYVDQKTMQCPICHGTKFKEQQILWPELINSWKLSQSEIQMLNQQQGMSCLNCGSNLRSMTLAGAILTWLNQKKTFQSIYKEPAIEKLHVLEINEAGTLHAYLMQYPNHTFAIYPEVDIQALPYASGSFNLLVHSDTLEHVPDPVKALKECYRVLMPGGCMAMTVPILPTRLNRRRHEMPHSYHGCSAETKEDMLVYTEYGADFYSDMIAAGWQKISLYTLGSMASIAIAALK